MAEQVTRRRFVGTAAAVGVASIVPRHVLGGAEHVAPSEKITVAHIGMGTQGFRELGGLLDNPQIQIVAVCDIIKEKADAAAERYGARAFYSVQEMVDSGIEIDAASMCTRGVENGGDHFQPTMDLLNAGIPTLGEKPISNDVSEARALSEVFGARAHSLPVTAAKGSIGHLLGSSGAVEAVATVLALLDRAIQPTPGADPADPELGVDLVVGEPRPIAAASVGISTSFAFGGANAAVVLQGMP